MMSNLKNIFMENDVLLQFDKSCGFFARLFSRQEVFKYPIVYLDGKVSYLKSVLDKDKAWGFIYRHYIIRKMPTQLMLPSQVPNYCKNNTFAGISYTVPPYSLMQRLLKKDIADINHLLEEIGGKPFTSRWYMAKNDKWVNGETWNLDERLCGVNPQNLSNQVAIFIGEKNKAAFYPAIEL